MFVNISPLESNVPETISTLEFGQNARQVELGKATKHVTRHVTYEYFTSIEVTMY